ncbi:MAG: hypothetical protein HY721_24845 [Planctomycetes bacterium]|nr:hypothetical protein [Planctomycetota bacterium]
MKPGARLVLAAMVASALVALVVVGFAAASRNRSSTAERATPAAAPLPGPTTSAVAASTAPEPVAKREEKPPPEVKPIEEVLAESGEDLGAVYYMSRVREAIREGNPAFARELLRQFKEQHPGSVLVEEAEALLARGR